MARAAVSSPAASPTIPARRGAWLAGCASGSAPSTSWTSSAPTAARRARCTGSCAAPPTDRPSRPSSAVTWRPERTWGSTPRTSPAIRGRRPGATPAIRSSARRDGNGRTARNKRSGSLCSAPPATTPPKPATVAPRRPAIWIDLDRLVFLGRDALEVAAGGGAEGAPEGGDEGAGALVADRVRGRGDGGSLGEQLQGAQQAGPLAPHAERQTGFAAEQPLQCARAGRRGTGDLGQRVAR